MEEIADKAAWRERAKGILLFRYMEPAELAALMDKAAVVRAAEGELVVREGERDPYLYAVLDGTVSVQVCEGEGCKDVYMCSLGQGDVFGEAGMFLKVKRTASVACASDAVFLRLHREELGAFIKAKPAAGNKLLLVVVYGLLRKLRAANQELAYERKSDMDQADVDSLLADMMGV